MSLQLNTVQLAGHVTRDPVIRIAGSSEVADIGLAINRRYKANSGELREEVTFVDITAWGTTAKFLGDFVRKGTALYVEGRLQLDQWDDKDGNKRTKLKVVADRCQFVESKGGGHGSANSTGTPANQRPSARAGDPGPSQSADPLAGKNGAPPRGDDDPPF